MNITGGKYNSRKVKAPDYKNIKPTLSKVRQGIFNSLLSMIDSEDKIFVDMFAGSGIMSLEALSRGFEVILFEKDRKTALSIKESFNSFGLKPNLYTGDSVKILPGLNIKADVIFLDPPYDSELYETAFNLISDNDILNENGIIIAEYPQNKLFKRPQKIIPVKVKNYGDKQISFYKKISQAE